MAWRGLTWCLTHCDCAEVGGEESDNPRKESETKALKINIKKSQNNTF